MKEVVKYLGVLLDRHLSWDAHTDDVCKRLRPRVGTLARACKILPAHLLHIIYITLVQSTIDYALSVWGNTSQRNLNKIQKFQNRCARLITGNYDQSFQSTDIVMSLGWQTVQQRKEYFPQNYVT